jgi:hypothetical protein
VSGCTRYSSPCCVGRTAVLWYPCVFRLSDEGGVMGWCCSGLNSVASATCTDSVTSASTGNELRLWGHATCSSKGWGTNSCVCEWCAVLCCWFCVCRSHAQPAAPVEVRFPSAHPTHGAPHHANAGTRSPGEEEGSTGSPALRRKAQSLDARIRQLEVRERVLAHKLTEVRLSRCALHVRPWVAVGVRAAQSPWWVPCICAL